MLRSTMKLSSQHRPKIYRTLWGTSFPASTPEDWTSFMRQHVTDAGFDGIECCAPGPFFSFAADPEHMFAALAAASESPAKPLDIVLQIQTMDYPVASASWKQHINSFHTKLDEIMQLVDKANRLVPDSGRALKVINCHAGKDSMSIDGSLRFFEAALELERTHLKPLHVPLVFETHRQRILHSPFRLLDLHRAAGDLMKRVKYNADLSHFVLALERYPTSENDREFWDDVMWILEEQAWYIHARVGSAQCIQLADPFSPEHELERSAFGGWWVRLAAAMRRRGVVVRAVPEYGPAPYQPLIPGAQKPLKELDDVVLPMVPFLYNVLTEGCDRRKE